MSICIYTAGKISIFLSKYISKGAVDLTFSQDVGNNPSNPYIKISSEIKLYVIKWNDMRESIGHVKKWRGKKAWKAKTPAKIYR